MTQGEKEINFAVDVKKGGRRVFNKNVGGKIDTSIVLTLARNSMYHHFQNATPNHWDMTFVPDKIKIKEGFSILDGVFSNCSHLLKVDLTEVALPKTVRDISHMFSDCNSIKEIKIGGAFDTSNITNMQSLFRNTWSLRTIDLSELKTQNVRKMGGFFEGSGITSLDLTSFETENVSDMNSIFRLCKSLVSLNLNFDMKNASSVSMMFEGCSNLASGNIRFFNVPKSKWADREAFMAATMLDKCPVADKVIVEFAE